METDMNHIDDEVRKYSVIVGFLLIAIFVVPCISLALLAKCFQKQSNSARRRSTRNSIRSSAAELEPRDVIALPDSADSIQGYGIFGLLEMSLNKLECIERTVSLKDHMTCVENWKGYAPHLIFGGTKKIIAIRRLASGDVKDGMNHNMCLKTELSILSRLQPHHAVLNLLGVASPNSSLNSFAVLLEYPLYGSLHSFLVCKRRGCFSNSTNQWAGLNNQDEEDSLLKAMPDESRPFLSSSLADSNLRSRAFKVPMNVALCDMDHLLFGLQIVNGLEFLETSGVSHSGICTENIVISYDFYLKLSGLSSNAPSLHRKPSAPSTRSSRSPYGRNKMKWDSPEVLQGAESTEKSLVWRFSMILWEICSLGDTPFADVPGKSLVEILKKGDLPNLPETCSNELYSLMESCWKIEVDSRPTFSQLTTKILNLLKSHEEQKTEPCNFSPVTTVPHHQRRRPSLIERISIVSSAASESMLLPENHSTPSPDHQCLDLAYNETDV